MKIRNSLFLVFALMAAFAMTSFQTVSAEVADNKTSPKKQMMSGISAHEVQCKDGYSLVVKASDMTPACCKSSSVDKLIERGWAADNDTMHDFMMESMINLSEGTVDTDKAMSEAKEMMKEASENPTAVSEGIDEMMAGTAQIVQNGDQTFLRFEKFEVTNGPDLRVYLTSDGNVKNGIQLDKLKGSTGDQNYPLGEDIDVGVYDTVVICCQPFGVYFGQASMS